MRLLKINVASIRLIRFYSKPKPHSQLLGLLKTTLVSSLLSNAVVWITNL